MKEMNRRKFINKMKNQGFNLIREGNSWYLAKDFDDLSDNKFILFIRKRTYTSQDDDFKSVHTEEWCDLRAWGNNINNGNLIGGKFDYLPFALVEDYLLFFNKLYQYLKYESNT